MQTETLDEARRQVEICNACRYCEGYCAVFPAVHAKRSFANADIRQLANLCHNCRACYYACQYAPPHEFAVNLPAILARTRRESWKAYSWPGSFAKAWEANGLFILITTIIAIAAILWVTSATASGSAQTFYDLIPHSVMVAVFLPAFLMPVVSLTIGVRRYWRDQATRAFRWRFLWTGLADAASLRNLNGGHGDGCNFEDGDRFSQARRWFHQLTLWGFLLCFAATSAATLMHYLFNLPAPYGPWSAPKLLGVPGGVLLCIGAGGLAWLRQSADPGLDAPGSSSGDLAFITALFLVSATGLALYWLGDTPALRALLVIHLGCVLAFFLFTPYSKMAHGFYRLAALAVDASRKTRGSSE